MTSPLTLDGLVIFTGLLPPGRLGSAPGDFFWYPQNLLFRQWMIFVVLFLGVGRDWLILSWPAPVAGGRWPVAGRRWALGRGRWPLVGRWPVAAGCWAVTAGRWPLAGGRWPVAIREAPVSCFYFFGEPLKTWTYAMLSCIVCTPLYCIAEPHKRLSLTTFGSRLSTCYKS